MELGTGFHEDDVETQIRNELNFSRNELNFSRQLLYLPRLSNGCCIFRVRSSIRVGNERAFTPQVISIGPLHHGRSELKTMEVFKWSCLNAFLRDHIHVDLKDYIDIVQRSEHILRDCYQDVIPLSSNEFVKLILLDAVFIIQVLLNFTRGQHFLGCADPVGDLDSLLVEDLLMLENQIPFFIVQEIYEHAQSKSQTRDVIFDEPTAMVPFLYIKEICRSFIKSIPKVRGEPEPEPKPEDIYEPDFEHILDLMRKYLIQSHLSCHHRRRLRTYNIPTVTELRLAGVRLQVGSSKNLLDIKFNDGILEIPKIFIWNRSAILNVNIANYELSHHPSNKDLYVSHYFFLLGLLVKTTKDVELLIKYGVVAHTMNDPKAVLTFIHDQSTAISIDLNKFCFTDLCENLDTYCRKSWHLWKENLKQNYFNTPWTTLSVIAAFVILILTFIQTVCSILSLKSS